jgi:hypothetical protein
MEQVRVVWRLPCLIDAGTFLEQSGAGKNLLSAMFYTVLRI